MRIPAVVLLLAAAGAAAQEPAPKPPAAEPPKLEMDETSKALVEGWQKRLYRLDEAGVTRASCKVKASLDQVMVKLAGTATYRWDGKRGSLEWDNPQLGAMMAQRGWSSATFDANFRPSQVVTAGKLTAKAEETRTVVTVDDAPPGSPRELYFDKEGTLTGLRRTGEPARLGGAREIVLAFQWEKAGEKVVMAGWVADVDVPGVGRITETTRITYEEAGGRRVPVKSESTSVAGQQPMGSRTVEISDWKFNDEAE